MPTPNNDNRILLKLESGDMPLLAASMVGIARHGDMIQATASSAVAWTIPEERTCSVLDPHGQYMANAN